MSNKRIIELLEDQLRLSAQREGSLLEQLRQQSIRIEELTASIRSLEEALLLKNGNIQTLADKNRGLSKLLSGKSEKNHRFKPCWRSNGTEGTSGGQSQRERQQQCH